MASPKTLTSFSCSQRSFLFVGWWAYTACILLLYLHDDSSSTVPTYYAYWVLQTTGVVQFVTGGAESFTPRMGIPYS